MPQKTQLSSLLTTFPCHRAFTGEGHLLTLWATSQGCIPVQMDFGMSVPGHTAPWGGQRTVVHSPAHWAQPSAPSFVEHKHRQTRAHCQRAPPRRGTEGRACMDESPQQDTYGLAHQQLSSVFQLKNAFCSFLQGLFSNACEMWHFFSYISDLDSFSLAEMFLKYFVF